MATHVKFIVPGPYRPSKIREAIAFGLSRTGELVKVDYALATSTWEAGNVPEWQEQTPRLEGGALVWKYTTESTPFVYVDNGTVGGYPIVPVNAKFLRFTEGFIPKTKPGRLLPGPGARFGDYQFRKKVIHPGVEPRDMSGEVADRADMVLAKFILESLGEI